MARVQIEVMLLEFEEHGNTIWVQDAKGTVLRIKTMGKIVVDKKCNNIVAHSDIIVKEDIHICIPPEDL